MKLKVLTRIIFLSYFIKYVFVINDSFFTIVQGEIKVVRSEILGFHHLSFADFKYQ